jgi:hypothetical protein
VRGQRPVRSAVSQASIRGAVWCTLAAAAVVSSVDAALLQARRDFFTGGFLSTDSATAWTDRVLFAAASLGADAVWTGLGVLLALVVAGRLRLGRVARGTLMAVCGIAPLVVAGLVEYQVFAYLGDAFDFALMFDLVGRRASEILAVVSSHVLGPLLAAVACGALVLGLVVILNRRYPHGVWATPAPTARLFAAWAGVGLVLIGATTLARTSSEVQDNGLRRKASGQLLGALVTRVTDIDRDGVGMLSRPPDPAPFDARVYPYALDMPGNGIDENGVGGDLPAGAAAEPASAVAPPFKRKPNVLLVMLETFRADLIDSREGGREVTPVLNALAAEGGWSSRAYSHNGYTVQSRYHLFTGRLAGAGRTGTLLDDFRSNGYEIAYFSAQDESFGGAAYDIGAAQADTFYDARQDLERRYTTFATSGSLGVAAGVVLSRVQRFLDQRDPSRPLFLYVNLYDTHFPYVHGDIVPLVSDVALSPAQIGPDRAADVTRMYRNTAANVDQAIGVLLEKLRTHLGSPPATIVLADHGESLFDEGFLGHGYAINEVQMRIPLLARGLALDVCEPVGQADLRQAIGAALGAADQGQRPRFRACVDQQVFQYLGALDRPRQIALTRASDRIVYDFREQRAQLDGKSWQPMSALDGPQREKVLALVHFWERMQLQAGRSPS